MKGFPLLGGFFCWMPNGHKKVIQLLLSELKENSVRHRYFVDFKDDLVMGNRLKLLDDTETGNSVGDFHHTLLGRDILQLYWILNGRKVL